MRHSAGAAAPSTCGSRELASSRERAGQPSSPSRLDEVGGRGDGDAQSSRGQACMPGGGRCSRPSLRMLASSSSSDGAVPVRAANGRPAVPRGSHQPGSWSQGPRRPRGPCQHSCAGKAAGQRRGGGVDWRVLVPGLHVPRTMLPNTAAYGQLSQGNRSQGQSTGPQPASSGHPAICCTNLSTYTSALTGF